MFKRYQSYSGKQYVYDSETNSFFLLDKESNERVPNKGESDALAECYKEYREAKSVDCIRHQPFNKRVPNILSIEVTQQCNLRCDYCVYSGSYKYERKHNNQCMSEDTFSALIAKLFSDKANMPNYVGFYGGEPLLCIDRINAFHDQIKKINDGIQFQITTNGTMFTEGIIERLVKDNYHVTVSFDGLNHDLYRRTATGHPTASKIVQGLKNIREHSQGFFNNNLQLQITLAPPYHLLEQAAFFNNHSIFKNIPLGVAFVNIYDTSFLQKRDGADRDLSTDFLALAHDLYHDYANNHFQKAFFQKHLDSIVYRSMDRIKNPLPRGNCEFFLHRGFIDVKGDVYPCERVGRLGCFGNVHEDTDFASRIKALHEEYDGLLKKHCRNCVISRFCGICSSRFREGDRYNAKRFMEQCDAEQKWFDIVIPLFLSLKEKSLI